MREDDFDFTPLHDDFKLKFKIVKNLGEYFIAEFFTTGNNALLINLVDNVYLAIHISDIAEQKRILSSNNRIIDILYPEKSLIYRLDLLLSNTVNGYTDIDNNKLITNFYTKLNRYFKEPTYPVDKSDEVFSNPDPKLSTGSKKPSMAAIPPISILLLGLAMKDGEKKYGRFNWRKTKVDNSVYYDAALRHLLSYWDGEDLAEDSKIQHLAHVMACCAILIDAHYTNSNIDTRDSTKVVSSYIDEYFKRNKENG